MFSAQNTMIDNRYLALWSTTCPHLSMQRLLALAPRSACSALQLRLFSAASEGAKANLSKKAAAPNSAAASLTKPVSPPSASFKPSVVASAPALQSDASARDLLSAVAAVGGATGESYWGYEILEAKWVQRLMQDGRKETALLLHNKMLAQLKLLYPDKDPRDLFAAAVLRARPFAEVKSVRIGGSSYRVPVEIPEKRQRSLVLRWMVLHARKRWLKMAFAFLSRYTRANAPLRKVKSMHVAMAQEVQAILNNQGDTVAKRDECHKMADANREYVHFRWGKFWNTQSRVYVHFRWGKFGNKIMEATTMFYESCAQFRLHYAVFEHEHF
jgi:small subunit ribosomal protein S7